MMGKSEALVSVVEMMAPLALVRNSPSEDDMQEKLQEGVAATSPAPPFSPVCWWLHLTLPLQTVPISPNPTAVVTIPAPTMLSCGPLNAPQARAPIPKNVANPPRLSTAFAILPMDIFSISPPRSHLSAK